MSRRRAHDGAALAVFLSYVDAVPFDEDATVHFAEIRADLSN